MGHTNKIKSKHTHLTQIFFSKLDLRSSDGHCFPCAIPLASPAFHLLAPPAAPHSASHALGCSSHAPSPGALLPSALPNTGVALFFGFFYCLFISVLVCCLGFSLPLRKTLVFGFVFVPLFSTVLDLDYYNSSTTSATFTWLLLFPSGGTNGPVLLFVPLAFLTALCGTLRGSDNLFNPFSTFCNYFNVVLVWFESNVGEPTHFSSI